MLESRPPEDEALLQVAVAAVQSAGSHLKERFSTDTPRFQSFADVVKAIHANDEASLAFLREPLLAARSGAQWVEEEDQGGELPPGEWWITDPVEGNINHIHGLADWGLTATLVRDNLPVLTAIHLPLSGLDLHRRSGRGCLARWRPAACFDKDRAECGARRHWPSQAG